MVNNINLTEAIHVRQMLSEYRDVKYMSMLRQIKEKTDIILADDLGTQFVSNCGRDLAGEVIRNFFDTSDYNITVDQLAVRILKFKYEDEYDPLKDNSEIQKSVYNYSDMMSSTLDKINNDLDSSQEKLFNKVDVWNENKQKYDKRYEDSSLIQKGKREYVNSIQKPDGSITDEYTEKKGEYVTDKNGNISRRQEVDHVQAVGTAKYNAKYISDDGKSALKVFYNSPDNFAMMDKIANGSKGDVKVFDSEGNDITHRATPEQLADAVCQRWENVEKADTKNELKNKGYLNDDGKVPKSVKKQLENNLRHSQNVESNVILKNTDYSKVASDALKHTKSGIGKIIAGQVIYYAVPPIIYEIKEIIKKKNITIDNAISKLAEAGKRIGRYVYGHLKDIFKNIAENSLKKFIKSFMDIIIGMVKGTVQKLMKVLKSLVMSVVDSVKIITTPNTTPAQKADATFNLFGITVTNIVIELLFEAIEKGAHIPEILLKPLQIITSVICTNFTMLILQKADLFDVRRGFKLEQIRQIFAEEREIYKADMLSAEQYSDIRVEELIESAKRESLQIYDNIMAMDMRRQSVRNELEKINSMFDIGVDFESKWLHFLGITAV